MQLSNYTTDWFITKCDLSSECSRWMTCFMMLIMLNFLKPESCYVFVTKRTADRQTFTAAVELQNWLQFCNGSKHTGFERQREFSGENLKCVSTDDDCNLPVIIDAMKVVECQSLIKMYFKIQFCSLEGLRTTAENSTILYSINDAKEMRTSIC